MHTCPWPTEGEAFHWHCTTRTEEEPVTAYRDRLNAGEYDPAKPESKAKPQKAATTRAAKSTTSSRKTKRSSK